MPVLMLMLNLVLMLLLMLVLMLMLVLVLIHTALLVITLHKLLAPLGSDACNFTCLVPAGSRS